MQQTNHEAAELEVEKDRAETDRQRMRIDDARLQLEQQRFELERYRAKLANLELQRPLLEGVMRFADLTVRSLLILNGGAAIGLLTFVTNNGRHDLASLVFWFGLGAWLGVATAAASYLAQVLILEPKSEKVKLWGGQGMRGVAIILGFAALIVFGCGMYQVSQKITPPKTAVLTAL